MIARSPDSPAVRPAAADPGYDALVHSAALITACPVALIGLWDGSRVSFKAAHGIELSGAAHVGSLCERVLAQASRLEIDDLALDARWSADVSARSGSRLRYYFGEPLMVDAQAFGTLCVIDTQPRRLTEAQLDAVQSLAQAASELLRSHRHEVDLERERQRLFDLARASGDWLWETDAVWRYVWISGAFDRITGEPAASKIGNVVADSLLLDGFGQPQGDGARLHDLLRTGRAFHRVLTEKLTPAGRLVISRSAVPVLDNDARVTGWRGTARDLTENVQQALRLHAQNELMHQVSREAPGVIYQFVRHADGRGEFQYVNERVVDLFGLTPAQLKAESTCFYSALHPDDRLRVQRAIAANEVAGRALQVDYRVIQADGSERWVTATSSPERQPDGSVIWRGFVADATERKNFELALRASEERWEIAADATGIGIAQAWLDDGRMQFDARACANHGLPFPHPPYSIDDWLANIVDADRLGAQAALLQAIEHSGRLDIRCRFGRPDGSQPWLEIVARVEHDAHGKALSLIGTCRDVTDQTALVTLRQAKETAERASQAKTAFLSRVSHELRTPLNGILGFAQLMALDRDHPLADEQQRRLDGVQRSGQHLLALVNDVLDIARIEQDDFKPRCRPVDLVQAVDACIVMMLPLATERAVRIDANLPGACWVLADARALEQVLMNLLSNAIKYNRHGGEVRLRAEAVGGRVELGIEDEGHGLSEAEQAQLFQPFNRLGAERRRIGGNGLGLVIARQLTLAMQGELRVLSRPGSGCRFTLKLEATAAPDDETPTVPSALDEAPAPAGPERCVLYIEDEPLNVVLMQEVFRHSGDWALHIARDGAEGLALARSLLPDLLLIDINLPDMSGINIIRHLRSDAATADLHCIALSADAMHEQIAAAHAAGFDDYWTKPINVAALMRTVSGTLARGRRAP